MKKFFFFRSLPKIRKNNLSILFLQGLIKKKRIFCRMLASYFAVIVGDMTKQVRKLIFLNASMANPKVCLILRVHLAHTRNLYFSKICTHSTQSRIITTYHAKNHPLWKLWAYRQMILIAGVEIVILMNATSKESLQRTWNGKRFCITTIWKTERIPCAI